jgi:putative membrane protein
MWHWGFDAWWMSVMMLVFWAVIIGIVVWAVRTAATGRAETGPSHRRALEILEERYARGEIDEDEFRHRRTILESKGG